MRSIRSMGLRRRRTRYSPVRNYHIKSLDVSYNRLTLEKFFTTFPRRQRRGRWAGDGTPVCRCMQGAVNNRISSLENTAPSGSLCDRSRRCGASYLLVSLPDISVRLDCGMSSPNITNKLKHSHYSFSGTSVRRSDSVRQSGITVSNEGPGRSRNTRVYDADSY